MQEHSSFLFYTGYSTWYRFFISNRYSTQEFGDVKKLAQRDLNPVPADASVILFNITPQGESQLTITTR